MRRGPVWASLFACLFACSSDSGDSTSVAVEPSPTTAPRTFEEWRDEAAAFCEEHTPKAQAVASRHPGVDTLDEVVAVFEEMVPLAEESLQAYRRIRVPDERTDEVRRIGEVAQEQLATMKNLLQTARDGNLPGTQYLIQVINTQSTELVALYNGVGVEECARIVQIT